jgi:hypothetical protein
MMHKPKQPVQANHLAGRGIVFCYGKKRFLGCHVVVPRMHVLPQTLKPLLHFPGSFCTPVRHVLHATSVSY